MDHIAHLQSINAGSLQCHSEARQVSYRNLLNRFAIELDRSNQIQDVAWAVLAFERSIDLSCDPGAGLPEFSGEEYAVRVFGSTFELLAHFFLPSFLFSALRAVVSDHSPRAKSL